MVIVKTSPEASDRRDAIRATWGRREELEWEEEEEEEEGEEAEDDEGGGQPRPRRERFFRLRIFFLLGRPSTGPLVMTPVGNVLVKDVEKDVRREAQVYDDILM